ncbi:MAG: 4-hydroxy-tetrahydrodipicolinate synthase [Methanosarcinaceae archaeon]|nr:4-hydroxy-tetrahydrodipicolinate synthase [Methanosarcinaceae archaeon]
MFEGVLPALITPFSKDNSIDKNGFQENVSFVETGGISGIVACGTTGESATLSTAEHEQLIDISVDCANVPVLVGTGSNNTAEAIELTKYADDAGVDGALLISPYYNKPNNAGLIKHFKIIAESVDIPILLYNVPTRTSQDIPLEVILELSKVDNIVGIKEASGNLDKITRIIENTADEDFSVISGDDGLTLPILTLGGSAVISVVANIVPQKMVDLYNAAKNYDITTARNIHYELAPLIRALFNETNPIPVKRAAELIGLASGHLRLPLAPISSENERILIDALKNIGALND